jgi:hypothetical protein
MHTFSVSDVRAASDPLPEVSPREALEALIGGPVEALYTPSAPLARAYGVRPSPNPKEPDVPYHPFVAAVHAAFDQHRPLILTPDAVWLMIAQGLALHIGAHAEALRQVIVPGSEGRETLRVRRDDFVKGAASNPWPEVFGAFSEQVRTRTGDLHPLLVADFSTTDPTSRAASEVVLLAAAQPYFVLQFVTLCGIPSISLTGTVDDWRAIRRRVDGLAKYGAQAWAKALAPVIDQFVAVFEGPIERSFWRSFYKLESRSGGPHVTGWINVLLPYVLDHRGAVVANPSVSAWRDHMEEGHGATESSLPSGLSTVPFLWKHLGDEHRMQFVAGFTGVAQDPRSLALRPEIGWAVRDAGASLPGA